MGIGSNSCVEKKFKLDTRKYEEYKGVRFGNGDCALVVSDAAQDGTCPARAIVPSGHGTMARAMKKN